MILNKIYVTDITNNNPDNRVAKEFYSSFGFSEICMDEGNKDMLSVI